MFVYPIDDVSNRRLGLKAAPPDLCIVRNDVGSSRVAARFFSFFFLVTIKNSALSGLFVGNGSIEKCEDRNCSSRKLALIGELITATLAPSFSNAETFVAVI